MASMRRLGDWTTGFVVQWKEAADAGLTLQEFADLLDMPYMTAAGRAARLRKRGIRLPALRRTPHKQRRIAPAATARRAWAPTKSQAKFIKAYKHAAANGLTFEYVCERLGITRGAAFVRKCVLKKRGVILPPLRWREPQRVAAKRAVVVPSVTVAPASFTAFTITVGGGA